MCNSSEDKKSPVLRLIDYVWVREKKSPLRIISVSISAESARSWWREPKGVIDASFEPGEGDGVDGAGGGCPLQVWTYLASGYNDDKIYGARGSDSGIQTV